MAEKTFTVTFSFETNENPEIIFEGIAVANGYRSQVPTTDAPFTLQDNEESVEEFARQAIKNIIVQNVLANEKNKARKKAEEDVKPIDLR
jgi:hypothetical protein